MAITKKARIIMVGIAILFVIIMGLFVSAYNQATSNGIPVIVSKQQFQSNYFEEFSNIVNN